MVVQGPENRLTADFLVRAINPALDHVELAWRKVWKASQQGDKEAAPGALVITGNLSQEKFFCNGLDLAAALAEPGFFQNVFHPWLSRIMTFPIPTVAAINGHAFAGGWLLAAACDYRIMSSGKCWASMPEIHLASDFPHGILVFLLTKLRDPVLLRKQLLEGHRWTPQELLAARMVDDLVDGRSREILAHAVDLARTCSSYATSGTYGSIKSGMYSEVLDAAELDTRLVTAMEEDAVTRSQLSARARL